MHPALQTVLQPFEQAAHADTNVFGVLYTGSLGRGTADQFSDLDIEVWVTDAAYAQAQATAARCLGYGGTIHFCWHIGTYTCSFVGADWRRVDLTLHRWQDMQPAPHYAQATVIKDTDQRLHAMVAQSVAQPITVALDQVRSAIAEAIDSQIYLAMHNARGAVWSATGEVSYRCAELYTVLTRIRGRESFGFRYVETLLTPAEQALLQAAWPSTPTRAEVRRAARAQWTWTRHVWQEAERVLGRSLDITIDEGALLAAVDRIYTW